MSLRRLGLAIALILGCPAGLLGQEVAASARRLAAVAQLAAEEYRLGVKDGRVIAAAEVEETRLFLGEARRHALRLPPELAARSGAALDTLVGMVERIAEPDSVTARVRKLLEAIARELGIALDEVPAEVPSLARGREIYQQSCAMCHGTSGGGDGPQAASFTPPPANLADAAALAASSPLDFYRRVTVGTAGTAMAAYEHVLSARDRWAVALYASTLRLPRPTGRVPEPLRSFQTTAAMSDTEVLAALGPAATASHLAAVRTLPTQAAVALSAVFGEVRSRLDSAYALTRLGRADDARAMAMDAYVTFERVERDLMVKDPGLTAEIEAAFSSLRDRAGAGATPAQLSGIRTELARILERAERTIVDRPAASNLFFQSFVILAREGLEAILLIGALMAFLVKTGNRNRRRDIHFGVAAAVGMSLLTALALETIFALSPANQEGLEGGVMLLAAATLFYVSYWLLSKLEVAKWNRFVRGRMERALSRGSAFALASVAFLAVYREGFETVLFYKALAVSGAGSGGSQWPPILGGILAGAALLAVVYFAINRFGVRLPLKPLFGATGALLYYMAFVFAGKGVAELQEGGLVGLTPVSWAPRLPAMGIYPTLESLALQGLLLLLALVALTWVFLLEPRRLRVTRVLVPEPEAVQPREAPPAPPAGKELLRSIDRIEADLAEVRSELERMRERVNPEEREARERPG